MHPMDRTQADTDQDWYRLSAEEAFDALDSGPDGLTDDEVRQRADRYGPNRIREQQQVSRWRVLLDQFRSPLIYVLVAALAVTLALQDFADSIVIGVVLVINTVIGYTQEYQAASAVTSLMELVAPRTAVRRDGEQREIDADELVPGDVVSVQQGRVVPADLRLVEVHGLQVNEAPLTGESVPATKSAEAMSDAEQNVPPADQKNLAFMGTAVTSGGAVGVVVATGSDSQIGQIAEEVQQAGDTTTPLQQRIERLARFIALAVLVVAVAAGGMGLLLGESLADMVLLAVSLAVAAVPEGLPIVVTVALAIGVRRMAQRHAIVRQLPAVETLGSTTTILSDKTGTLTENRMSVQSIHAGGRRYSVHGRTQDPQGRIGQDGEEVEAGHHPALHETLLVGALCNDVTLEPEANGPDGVEDEDNGGLDAQGDPMEVALLLAALKAGLSREELVQRYPRRETVPFRTEQRFMATINDVPSGEQGPLVLVKGAPERIAEMCQDARSADGGTEQLSVEEVRAQSESLAREGLRVLAMAVGRGEQAADAATSDDPVGLTFVGMQGLLDPPRESAVHAVDQCHEAGIRVVMVTGDHAATAAAIGERVHLHSGDGRALRGQDLAELDDDELDRVLDDTSVFARVTPQQKLRLVERLKANGEVVAVTGDGVNDAPALEAAHLGAAMGSGTDVAKDSSDMVVTDDNFASIYAAVEEGRTAFRNIRMATFFLLSTGAAAVLTILSAFVLGWPLPLLPAQLLWINVVTNGIQDVALAFEPGEKSLYKRPPRPPEEGVLSRNLVERLVLIAVWLAVGTLGVFYWQWGGDEANLDVARTAAVTTMVLFQMVHVFNSRSEQASLFSKSPLTNKVLLLGTLGSLAVHVAAIYLPFTQEVLRFTPISAQTWGVAALVASTAIIVNEAHKRLRSPASISGPDRRATSSPS
jgi:cation-transporting P-type ATPase F